jgi:hypothetical protein
VLVVLALALVAWKGPAALRQSMRHALGSAQERPRRAAHLAALWAGCLATLLSGGFLFPYHHQILALPGALTAAIALGAIVRPVAAGPAARRPARECLRIGAPLLAFLAVAGGLEPEDRAFLTGSMRLSDYQDSPRFDWADFSFRRTRELARFLSRETRPEERVQIFGHGSLALFLADRRAATRFSFTSAAMYPPHGRGGRDREEILDQLRAQPPPLIVIATRDALPQFGVISSDRQIADYPPLSDFLARRYRQDGMLADNIILRRIDPPPA